MYLGFWLQWTGRIGSWRDCDSARFHSIADQNDVAQLGWWGQATGGAATGYKSWQELPMRRRNNESNLEHVTKVSGFETWKSDDIIDFGAIMAPTMGPFGAKVVDNGVGGGLVMRLVLSMEMPDNSPALWAVQTLYSRTCQRLHCAKCGH